VNYRIPFPAANILIKAGLPVEFCVQVVFSAHLDFVHPRLRLGDSLFDQTASQPPGLPFIDNQLID
jgi:hypothetical protein